MNTTEDTIVKFLEGLNATDINRGVSVELVSDLIDVNVETVRKYFNQYSKIPTSRITKAPGQNCYYLSSKN